MSRPLFSIITGTYNRERYIDETIAGVLGQTCGDFEWVIVDDASTDATVEKIRAVDDPRIHLEVLPENSRRPAVPRNVALQRAQGEYIAFHDSDDVWLPGKLERQLALLKAHPDWGMVHSYTELIDEESQVLGVRHKGRLPESGDCFQSLLRHCFISISTVVVPRAVFEAVGLMDEDPFYRAKEDYEWFLRLAREYPVGLQDEVTARYRRAASGISAEDAEWRMRPEDVCMHERIWKRPELWEGRETGAAMKRIVIDGAITNAQHWRDQGCPRRACWFAGYALRRAPFYTEAWLQLVKSVVRGCKPRKA